MGHRPTRTLDDGPIDALFRRLDLACRGEDPELFFSDSGTHKDARDICATCPGIDDCREHAIARPWLIGVWGGTSVVDRQRIRRERAQVGG